MSKGGIIVKAERFETHHRIAVFCVILVGAILFTRVGVLFHNPNPVFLGMELHHFDYGIFLLIISAQLALFGPKKLHSLYVLLVAIGSGLILDEYWMIRHGVAHAATPAQEYNSTFPSVLGLTMAAVLCILFVNSVIKKRRAK
ncbi:hypothetical protein KW791_01770 [Candidatus Parcubacteria bacterium]|nr:hypothetical protein [Candidatus Parcubacteria bacterium]